MLIHADSVQRSGVGPLLPSGIMGGKAVLYRGLQAGRYTMQFWPRCFEIRSNSVLQASNRAMKIIKADSEQIAMRCLHSCWAASRAPPYGPTNPSG